MLFLNLYDLSFCETKTWVKHIFTINYEYSLKKCLICCLLILSKVVVVVVRYWVGLWDLEYGHAE